MPQISGNQVTAYVPTKNRYFTTLPSCLMAVAMQRVKPAKLIIFDDGDHLDLRNVPLYKNIFGWLSFVGIQWEVIYANREGQAKCHQAALEMAKTDWIWRLDDDNIAEPDALYHLLSMADDDVGAVGGLVLHPNQILIEDSLVSGNIEDVGYAINPQWCLLMEIKEVDHLYSTFLYRKEAGKHGYSKELSVIGHHEETMFTYQIKMGGWRVLINNKAITWHLRESTGGIRSFSGNPDLWDQDKRTFRRKLKEWGVKQREAKFIVLDCGLGDTIVFKKILPDIIKQNPDKYIIVACCYPEVFDGDDLKIISIGEAKLYFGKDVDKYNIYKWMWDRNWKMSLELAYRGMYCE
jgi:glycosyltransferase involved in cell wall biosynthesis